LTFHFNQHKTLTVSSSETALLDVIPEPDEGFTLKLFLLFQANFWYNIGTYKWFFEDSYQLYNVKRMKEFYVYILKCNDESYYTGHTDNLEARLEQHCLGNINCYTSKRRPLKLVYSEAFLERSQAQEAERQIKGWSRKKKEAFINKDFELLKKLSKRRTNEFNIQIWTLRQAQG